MYIHVRKRTHFLRTFGTGTSCALDLSFGMPALERHLRAELAHGMTEAQAQQWQQVVSALNVGSHDFESAMDLTYLKDHPLERYLHCRVPSCI